MKAYTAVSDKIWAKDKDPFGAVVERQESEAWFGFSAGGGDVNGNGWTDLIVSAINEDDTSTGSLIRNVGRAYVYRSDGLNPLSANPRRLTPGKLEAWQQSGLRSLVTGTLGTSQFQLVFVPAHNRDHSTGAVDIGAIDAYRLTGLPGEDISVFAPFNSNGLEPVFDPAIVDPNANPPINIPATLNAKGFGHCLVIADVNGDGMNDLVIGAPQSKNVEGRVYIYWGVNDPTNAPYGIDVSNPAVTILKRPPNTTYPSAKGNFGFWLDAADLDGDGKADLVVGEPSWPNDTSIVPGMRRRGLVYLFHGASIPVAPYPGPPRVLVETVIPVRTIEPTAPLNQTVDKENFGFYLWLMDYDGDGKKDLVSHGESTDWPGPAPAPASGAGAFYLHRNTSTAAGSPIVEQVANRVIFAERPQAAGRFAKNMTRITWPDSSGVVKDGFLLSEPDSNEQDSAGGNRLGAGNIQLYYFDWILSKPAGGYYNLKPSWSVPNNYMDDFGVETGPEAGEIFGRWIVVGTFTDLGGKPQFVTTASHRDVPAPPGGGSAPTIDAGAVVHLKRP